LTTSDGGDQPTGPRRVPALVGDLRATLPAWVTARLLVAAGFVVALAAADTLVPGVRPVQLDEGLLSWDGTFYQGIAERGYASLADAPVRFFPLYPLLGRALGVVFGGRADIALVVITNVAALGLGVLVRRLVLLEKGHEVGGPAVADRSVWLVMLVPPAFVLVFAYAEALLLVAAVGLFLCLRTQRWWWAAALGVAAALIRPHGLFLMAPAAVEVLRGWRSTRLAEWPARVAAVAGPAVGTAIYLIWSQRAFDDWQAPFRVQEAFRGEVVDPVTRLAQGVGDLGSETFGDGLHVPFAFVMLVLAGLTFRYWPASYGVYASVVVVVSLSAENLNSLERYGLNAFPLVLTLAVLVAAPRAERVALAVCGGGLLAFTSLALLGALVP
jgi:hypothetical protein